MKRTLAILAGLLLAMTACKQQDKNKPSQKPTEHTPTTSPTTPEKGAPGEPGMHNKGDTRDQATPSTGDRMEKDSAGTPKSDPPGDPPGDKPTMGERPGTGDTSSIDTQPIKTYSFADRSQMATDMKQKLDGLDAKIAQLQAKGDAKSQRVLDDVKTKRDQLSKQIDQIDQQTAANWDDFQKRVSRNFQATEKEVDVALKGTGKQGQTGSLQPGEGDEPSNQQPKTEQGGEG